MTQKPRVSFFLGGSKGRRLTWEEQTKLSGHGWISLAPVEEDGTLAERWLETERDWFSFRHIEESYSNWQEIYC